MNQISSKLKPLEQAIQANDPLRISKSLHTIKVELQISQLVESNSNDSKPIISQLMSLALPLTCHEDLNIRVEANAFISYWGSLLSGFAPNLLRTVLSEIDTSKLQPPSQAVLFTFWCLTLRSVAPCQRQQLIGTCQTFIKATKPEFLQKVPQDVWLLIRESMTEENLQKIIDFLINSPLSSTVAFLSQKSPTYYFSYVVNKSNLEFLKDFLYEWPKERNIDVILLEDTLLRYLKCDNSSHISASIEIITLLLHRYYRHPPSKYIPFWITIVGTLCDIYSKTNVAQKAAIIDCFTICARLKLISIDKLKMFLSYDDQIPTPILISITKLTALFIKEHLIPDNFLSYLEKQAIERDPLIFISIIEILTECFDELYSIAPSQATKIINLCLNPLPRYFVEQIQLIKLLENINFSIFLPNNLSISFEDIVLAFISDPHPSVIQELPYFLEKLSISLEYSHLDWFENASSYLPLIANIDPSFVVELIDAGLLPPASYEMSVTTILDQVQRSPCQRADDLFHRVLSVLLSSLSTLGFSFDRAVLSSQVTQWNHISKALPDLLNLLNEPIMQSTFGQIVNASVLILAQIIAQCSPSFPTVAGLFDVCRFLSNAFTTSVCKLVVALREYAETKFPELHSLVSMQVSAFFAQSFPFDCAVSVALSSFMASPGSACGPYILTAAETSREVLAAMDRKGEKLPSSNAFLAARLNMDYIKQCASEIPYNNWIIEEGDEEIIKQLSGIKISDFSLLSPLKIEIYERNAQNFDFVRPAAEIVGTETIEIKCLEKGNPKFLSLPISDFKIEHDPTNKPSWFKSESNATTKNSKEKKSTCKINILGEPNILYPYRKPCKADLTGFLWFSFRKVSIDEWNSIEEFCLNNINDERLTAAFFSYACRHGLDVDNEKWCLNLIIDRRNHFRFLSDLLLLSLLKKPLSAVNARFIEDMMIGLGHITADEEYLRRALNEEQGLSLLAVQTIFKLISADELPDEIIIKDIKTILAMPYNESIPIISKLFFPPAPQSRVDRFQLPPGVKIIQQILPSAVEPLEPLHVKLLDELVNGILDLFEEGNFSIFMIPILNSCELDENQFQKVIQYIDGISYIFPLSIVESIKNIKDLHPFRRIGNPEANYVTNCEELIPYFPPSYTREFIKLYLGYQKLTTMDDFKRIISKLNPVYFELLPLGYEKVSDKLIDERFKRMEESACLVSPLDRNLLFESRSAMSKCESRAAWIAKCLLGSSTLSFASGSANQETAISDVAQLLFELCARKFRFSSTTTDVLRVIVETAGADTLSCFAASRESVNDNNFTNTLLSVRSLAQRLGENGNYILTMAASLCEKENRKRAFEDENTLHALACAMNGDYE
ncbi:hypothetical protein TVAG_399080 [Trichomonas vaginalis G3]|uniref:Uncharacterized protein n=1 Tax=Trichomonas vaginalis (strain ATCC PRA-98 / G3) TaxID=412133 RepID=A2FRQ1_TRIV3|nr:armadillo (ARM) repeat-containing protein family [Trichomonas vaginalis G3]EAX92430.1 hypothetical protein TVAG_399080 [Trichomonas vaginalis G3]KAI5485219.1 armadillo (ARM) repeat-containing protein family [Trichomonas vaginalis G3]|eukprot:XP_001305360.1 hypothetical protein [Trichomonas vaginalis G3]